ncbi:hypothetical protein Plhal304r1_c019g0067181 [Plasmopara halstedii]
MMALLQQKELQPHQWKQLIAKAAKLLELEGEESNFLARMTISNLLKRADTSEMMQDRLLRGKTKSSTIFTSLMLQTKQQTLEEFFKLGLHIPMLSYVNKLFALKRRSKENTQTVANDIVRLLTANHNGDNLITWFGTYKSSAEYDRYIKDLIQGLAQQTTSLDLAFRLQAMRSIKIEDFYKITDGLPYPDKFELCLKYAAFIRFHFIEHEAKTSTFVTSQYKNSYKILENRIPK